MELYKIESLSFSYPTGKDGAIKNVNLSINKGDFITVCGKSGCGKTTLLRMLKKPVSPYGNASGSIFYKGQNIENVSEKEQICEIGFVMQDPENQVATDKVWHELAFGLESLGYSNWEIRSRVSETASFFGIENLFYKKTSELSGGEKQLLCLASVMVMRPEVIILDEPTSRLDPIAAYEFLHTLKKINDELGTTVVLSEQRLDEAFALSNRVIVMEKGEIIADSTPKDVGKILSEKNHEMFFALPVPTRVFCEVCGGNSSPVTVREGKEWLENYVSERGINTDINFPDKEPLQSESAISVKGLYFRYEKGAPDVIKGLELDIKKGEFFSILGGNGSGKTTALSLISGLNKAQRGDIFINGRKISDIPDLYGGMLGVLPQNPQSLFAKKTVYLDLFDVTDASLSKDERNKKVSETAALCGISSLLSRHPFDLSGGEIQRAALAMVLLRNPDIILLDEPTKGMDAHFKAIFGSILGNLKKDGKTILTVSHDVEFCAEYSDRCALFFDGSVTATQTPRKFFSSNSFYTTGANRMAKGVFPTAILARDVISALGKEERPFSPDYTDDNTSDYGVFDEKSEKPTAKRVIAGISMFIFCAICCAIQFLRFITLDTMGYVVFEILAIFFAALGIACFLPQKDLTPSGAFEIREKSAFSMRSAVSAIFILIAIPLTIFSGIYCFGDRKYYFISLLIIFETLLPFFLVFEHRMPKAREIVIISALSAIAVAGRIAFFMLPEFKPVASIVIISGICFGAEAGFMVGALSAFVSNYFFGQGPWTPWQMFAFGIIGFLAGLLFRKGVFRKTRVSLTVFGFLSALVIYGGIMNVAALLMMTDEPGPGMIQASFAAGLPVDFIHALSTAFFLWFLSEPMIEKLERVKLKYGLI